MLTFNILSIRLLSTYYYSPCTFIIHLYYSPCLSLFSCQTIEDSEDGNQISYIKLINVGQKVITRNCHGYLPSQVAFYLQNVHIFPRKIYLSVNSEAIENVDDLVGGEGMLVIHRIG